MVINLQIKILQKTESWLLDSKNNMQIYGFSSTILPNYYIINYTINPTRLKGPTNKPTNTTLKSIEYIIQFLPIIQKYFDLVNKQKKKIKRKMLFHLESFKILLF